MLLRQKRNIQLRKPVIHAYLCRLGDHLHTLKNALTGTRQGNIPLPRGAGDGGWHAPMVPASLWRPPVLVWETMTPPRLPAPHAAPSRVTMGRGGKKHSHTSTSSTMARDAGSDGDKAQGAGRTQPGLNLICGLGGTCSFSQIQGNSHKTQVICCNIVARSYSRFAETGDVLGVLGLPQSTAGRRYEISIYILQPGQESDNLTAKLRGEHSNLERPAVADGAGGVPRASGTWWPSTGCSRVPRSTQPLYPGKLLPTHPFCGLTT